MLRINSEKMSKSLGNFLLLRDVLKTVDPNVLRFLMLQTHYRSPLDFSNDRLSEAETALGRIVTFVRNLDWGIENAAGLQDVFDPAIVKDECRKEKIAFITAMDDDFNTSKALGTIFDFIGKKNAEIGGSALSVRDVASAQEIRDLIMELMGVFGLQMDKLVAGDEPQESDAYPPEIVTLAAEVAGYDGSDGAEAVDALLAARAEARAAKDWARADAIRDRLGALGFAVEDTPQGARISRVED
jgi:cysteinyl-tRNA synthetase